MANWLKQLIATVDYQTGRYEAFVVETDEDRQGCMQVLDEVRRVELNRVSGSSVLESAAFADVEVRSHLLACRDTRQGEIVGCVRLTDADQLIDVAGSREEYRLDVFDPDHLPRTCIATRLAFKKAWRKTAASLVLIDRMLSFGLDRDYLFCLLSCEPGLFNGYLRLGFRPLGRVRGSSKGGFRIPMFLVIHDLAHLQACRSPLARSLKRSGPEARQEGLAWYRDFVARRGEIQTGVEPYTDLEGEVHAALTDGLSEAGRRALLTHALTVECTPGQVLVRQDDGGQWLGIVDAGLIQVVRDDAVLSILGPGELFGEVALTLGRRRSAELVAATADTRVLLLSPSALARVTDPRDREILWRNIARVLAQRLVRLGPESESSGAPD